jgi:hypothetical protein
MDLTTANVWGAVRLQRYRKNVKPLPSITEVLKMTYLIGGGDVSKFEEVTNGAR